MSAPPAEGMIFDHIGVVVRDLGEGRAHLAALLHVSRWTAEFDDAALGVRVQFGADGNGGPAYELIAPLGEHSPVARALLSGRNILNHVAYRVADLAAAAAHLGAMGCMSTAAPQPAVAYGGAPVQFFLSPLRMMVELIEAPAHAHRLDGHA